MATITAATSPRAGEMELIKEVNGKMTKTQRKIALSIVLVLVALIATLLLVVNPAKAAEEVIPEGFTVESAQVKQYLEEGVTNKGALRFVIKVSEELVYSAFADKDVTYGTILLPADMLGENELTFSTANILDIKTLNWQSPDKDESGNVINRVYTSVLTANGGQGLPESYYNRPIAARAYIKDNETGDIYYSPVSVVRSIGYVATMNIATGSSDSDVLKEIAEATEKSISLDKTTLVNGADRIVPNVMFGGMTVPEEHLSRLGISYTSSGSGVSADEESKIISANGTGTATVQATLSIPGLNFTVNSEETSIQSHELVHVPGTPATCDTSGIVEHWSCAACSTSFADEAAAAVLSNTVSEPLGHNYEEVDRIEATYTTEGSVINACSRCYGEESTPISMLGHKVIENTVTLTQGSTFTIVALSELGGATEYTNPSGYSTSVGNTDWAYGFDVIRSNVQKGTGAGTNDITSFFRIKLAIDFTQYTSTTFEFGMNYNYGEFSIGGQIVKIPNQNAWNSFTIMGDGSVYLNGEQIAGAKMTGNSIVFELDTNRPDTYYGAFTIKKAVNTVKETREYDLGLENVTGEPISAIGGSPLTVWSSTSVAEKTVGGVKQNVISQQIQYYKNGSSSTAWNYFRYTIELDFTQFGSVTIPIATNLHNSTVFDVYVDGIKGGSITAANAWSYVTVNQDGSVYFNGTIIEGALVDDLIVIEIDNHRPEGTYYGEFYIGTPTFTLPEPEYTGPNWEDIDIDLASGMSGTKTPVDVDDAAAALGITSVTQYTFGGFQNAALASLDLTKYEMVKFYFYRPSTSGGGSIKDSTDGGYTIFYVEPYDQWNEVLITKSDNGYEIYVNEVLATALKNDAVLTNLNQLALNGSSGNIKYSNVVGVKVPGPKWEVIDTDIAAGMGGTKTDGTVGEAEAELGITSVKEYTFTAWQNAAFASLDLTKYELVKFYMYRPSTGGGGSAYDAADGSYNLFYFNPNDSWVEVLLKPAESGTGYDIYVNGTKATALKNGTALTNLNQIALNGSSGTVKYSNVFVVSKPGPKWENIDTDIASGMSGTKTPVTPTAQENLLGITSVTQYTFGGFQNAAFASLDLTQYEMIRFYMYYPSTGGGGSIKDATDGGYTVLYLSNDKDQWIEIIIKPAESGEGYELYANGAKATALKNGAALTNLNQLALNGSSGTVKYSNIMVVNFPEPLYKDLGVDIAAGMSGTKTPVTLTASEKELGITSVTQYTFGGFQNAAFASLDLTKYEVVKFYMYFPSTGGGGSIKDATDGGYTILYLSNYKDQWVEIEIRKAESGEGYELYANGTKATALKNDAALTNLNQLALNGSSGTVKYSNVLGHIAGEYEEPEEDVEETVKNYTIVFDASNTETSYASLELQKYFKEATGTRLFKSAYKSSSSISGNVIVLGTLPAIDKGFNFEGLGESDYVIKKDGNVIYIYGTTGYGVINGVYALLGDLFNLNIYYEDTYTLTEREGFVLTADKVTERVSNLTFDYIWSGLGELKPTEENAYDESYAHQMGFVTDYKVNYTNTHNATTLLEEYRSTHPEWFYSESGKTYGQIYLAAENFATGDGSLVRTVAEKLFDMLKKDTTYEREIALIFSAMDEDIWPHGTGYANSDALFDKYGTYAAENIIFMNAVARILDEMMASEPIGRTIQLELLCYNKTLVAPELSGLSDADKEAIMLYKGTHISVVPMIAPVEGNRHLSFADSRNKVKNPETGEVDSGSKTIAEVIEGWKSLANGNEMHMWWYANDGFDYFVMIDTITNMQANYQFAASNGITIMYNQSQGANAVAPDWSRLKIFVQSALQKDVNADIDTLIDEFMDVYFGAGAEQMKTLLAAQKTWYAKFFSAVFAENQGHYTAGGFAYSDDIAKWHFTETPTKPTFSFLDSTKNTMLVTWMGYIDSAKAAINADASLTADEKTELCDRVDLESLTIRYTLIEVFSSKTYDSSTNEFYQFAKSLGVTHYAEGKKIS